MKDRHIEAIIFDLGNTLFYFDADWEDVSTHATEELFRNLINSGMSGINDGFPRAFLNRLKEYYLRRETDNREYTTLNVLKDLLSDWGYPKVEQSFLRSALSDYYAVTQTHWVLEEDVVEVLDELKSRNYRLGIISNAGDDADVQAIVDNAGIQGYFDVILSSAAYGIRKPDPRIFFHVLDRWNIAPSKVAMVGDTLDADILGAKNIGMFSIWITRRVDVPAIQGGKDIIVPNATIDELKTLPELLNTL
jgi:2-haloalkanoic acid dehalogenase type II